MLLRRTVPASLIGGLLAYGAIRIAIIATTPGVALGIDYQWFMDQALRIRAGGPFYLPWELVSPIHAGTWADLHPPQMVVLLFLPMSFLPALVWWVVPLGTIAWVVWRHRPSAWGWVAILALLIAWPHTLTAILLGGSIMWIALSVALGTVYGSPAILVLLKPSLAPFALIGVRSRTWWIAGIVLGLASLAMIPAWVEYLQVLRNMTGFDWTYSLHDAGFVLIPVVAWVSSAGWRAGSGFALSRLTRFGRGSATPVPDR